MNRILILCSLALFLGQNVVAQHPITLSQQDCREQALAHSEDLQKAGNALEQARLDSNKPGSTAK